MVPQGWAAMVITRIILPKPSAKEDQDAEVLAFEKTSFAIVVSKKEKPTKSSVS